MDDIVALAVALGICFGAAAIGGYATSRSLRDWYVALPKPPWNPPNWIFGPVWTVLYLAMAVSAWLVWRTRDEGDVALPLVLFGVQLALNVSWSVAFFGLRAPRAALVVIPSRPRSTPRSLAASRGRPRAGRSSRRGQRPVTALRAGRGGAFPSLRMTLTRPSCSMYA